MTPIGVNKSSHFPFFYGEEIRPISVVLTPSSTEASTSNVSFTPRRKDGTKSNESLWSALAPEFLQILVARS